MLMMAGGCAEFTRFCIAMKPPKVALVLAHAATRMAASGAAALAHSASRIASRYARSNAVIRAAAQCRVDGGQGTGTVTGQAEGGAKGRPVGGGVEVAVFDHGDCLSLAGSAGGKKRIQIINGCQVRRRYGLVGRASGTKGVVCAAFLHRVRCEIVHRDHSRHGWREGRRNLWIAHIGNMLLAVYL